jgi:hypothetical protein
MISHCIVTTSKPFLFHVLHTTLHITLYYTALQFYFRQTVIEPTSYGNSM